MEIDKQEEEILVKAINKWQEEGRLNEAQAEELKQSLVVRETEREALARYFFIIALSCILLAFAAIFIDDKVLERLKVYFELNNIVVAGITGILAIGWFWYVRRIAPRITPLTYEIYMVLGALATLTSLLYICKDIGVGAAYTVFLFLAAVLLGGLSVWFRSKALWASAVLAFMGWYGAFSNWQSHDHIFLGMNYPVRFSVFGLVVTGLSMLQKRIAFLEFTYRITYVTGLLIFFTGMWGVSIFGNYNDLEEWSKVRQSQVLVYSILFGIAGVAALLAGIRQKDTIVRDIGILFLLLNLYTRYFEFFWDTMNKGIFFLILAITFWLIGRWLTRTKKNATQQA